MNQELEINWLLKEKYNNIKSADFLSDVEKLKAGEPLAYLIGSIPFLDTLITLDSRPLIPRTETEFWTEKIIIEIKKYLKDVNSRIKVLDLCAGSGCIGIAIAKAMPQVDIDFIEIEQKHIPTIIKNCTQNQIDANRYRVMSGDIYDTDSNTELNKYDFIVSNPPYIDPYLDRTEESVKDHEPTIALYGGKDGLELLFKIIQESPSHLKKEGQLWLEHEPEQSESIYNFASPRFRCSTQKDQYQVDRFSILVLQ
jgi:release factor glutamine methyltransferase